MKDKPKTVAQLPAVPSGRRPRSPYPKDFTIAAAKAVVDEKMSLTEVAKALKIPVTTVEGWAEKYRVGGAGAFENAPGRGGKRTKKRVGADPRRDAIVAVKKEQPHAGSRRIRDVVKRFFGIGTSDTTVRRVLQEEGLTEKREPPPPKPKPKEKRFERAEPNQLWQSDLFTFLLRRHERVYVAAFLDDHSRYLVGLALAHHQRSSLVMEALARAIAEYGTPREILTDQGRQYTAWRGSTDFEEELRRNGIRHVKSRPHHPQTCGKIERFWKTMWEEFLSRTVIADFADCQRRIALFVQHYNFQRPHQALGGMTPADRFFRSAPQVRAVVEATVAENALRIAQEKPVRKPFYLVGRLGDRELTITANTAGLSVRVGSEETTIPLSKESDDEGASTTRWNAGRSTEEESAPTGTEVAGRERDGRHREEPLPDGAVGALGREAGERRDRGDEDFSRDVLPDGNASTSRDARGAESAGDEQARERSAGAVGSEAADQRAGDPDRAAEDRKEKSGAAPVADPQVRSVGAGEDGPPWSSAEECAPILDPEWEEELSTLDGEGDRERVFDPDEGWRERNVKWERKLSGSDAPSDPAVEERSNGEEDVHADADRSATGTDAAARESRGGPGRTEDDVRGGARAGSVSQSLPVDGASGRDGVAGRDRAETGRPAGEAGERRDARSGGREAAEGEREAVGTRGNDGPPSERRERSPARPNRADGQSEADEDDEEEERDE